MTLNRNLLEADSGGGAGGGIIIAGIIVFPALVNATKDLVQSALAAIQSVANNVANWATSKLHEIDTDSSKAIEIAGLSGIASQYGLYECKEAAEAMANQNKNGCLIRLEFPNAYNGYVVAPKSIYGYNTAISQNGCHWGYCDEEHIVRCNIFPLGLPEIEWICSFTDMCGSEPIVTYIPLS